MNPIFSTILAVHIAAGVIAVILGLLPVFSRKGGALHRKTGRIYAVVMTVVLAAAWAMTLMRFQPYFAALSATATLQLFSGLRVLRRKRPDLNREERARPLDCLVTGGVLATGLWILHLVSTGTAVASPAIAYSLAGSAIVYAGYDLWRFVAPTAFPFFPRLWLFEHLVKMFGAYAAVMSAFAGNFAPIFPEPLRQLWPIILFQVLTVVFIVRHARRRTAA
ncbi:MAG TPA: hypothetical protein VGB49_01520 [Caulobacteraceae bacterium]